MPGFDRRWKKDRNVAMQEPCQRGLPAIVLANQGLAAPVQYTPADRPHQGSANPLRLAPE